MKDVYQRFQALMQTRRPQLKTELQSPHSDKKQTIRRRKEMTHCFVSK